MANDGTLDELGGTETMPGQTATTDGASGGDEPHAERGDDIGRYLVIGEIGSGGLGRVLRGYDPDLNRQVAIKLVRGRHGRDDSEGSQRSRRRLLREAQAIARLSHPNVVAVYEVDEHEGDVFIAMEYVKGSSAREWLRTPRSAQAILDVFNQAGRGLAAAHAAELVHRDFKPSNVLVGDDGRVRVADFGLARSFTDSEETALDKDLVASNETVTVAGTVVGTPAYMAPEQLRGETVDHRGDQFSFCLSLYEALTKHRPLVDRKHPVELSHTDRLPRHLVAPLRRGLAQDPNERFGDMEALLAALQPPSGRRAPYVAMTALVAVVVASVLLLSRSSAAGNSCAVAGDLSGLWDDTAKQQLHTAFVASTAPGAEAAFTRFRDGVDRYAQSLSDMQTKNCRDTRIRKRQSTELMDLRTGCIDQRRAELGALLRLLRDKPDAALIGRTRDMLFRLPSVAECRNAASLRNAVPLPATANHDAAARLDRKLAQARARLVAGKNREAVELATKLLPDARALGHAPTLARALLLQGEALHSRDKNKAAEAALREAAMWADRGRDDMTRARAYALLIDSVGVLQERKADGAVYIQLAQGVAERLDSDELRSLVLSNTARYYWWHGDFDKALDHARKSLALAERMFGDHDVRTADALWVLGVVLSDRREHVEAKKYIERSLATYRETLGDPHPKIGKAINSLAIIYTDTGDRKRGEKLYRQALDEYRRCHEDKLVITLTTMNLANNLSGQGEYAKALALYQRAAKAVASLPSAGPKSTRYADVLENEATTLSKMGRHAEAVDIMKTVERVRVARFGINHPITATTMRAIGRVELRAGHRDKALARFQQAVKILETTGGKNNPRLLRFLVDVGELQMQMGKLDAARATLQRAEPIAIAHPTSHTPALLGNIPDLLSETLWRLGKHDAARDAAKRALVLYRKAKRDKYIRRLERFLRTKKLQPR